MVESDDQMNDTDSAFFIAPLEYTCRTCGTEKTIHVSPIETDEGLVIDLDSRHRLAHVECTECDAKRTWVASLTLSGNNPNDEIETDGGRPHLHPQNDRIGDEGIGDSIMEYLNYYRFPPVYVTEHGEKKHESPLCPHVKGHVHYAICREDALYAYGENWCKACTRIHGKPVGGVLA